jgi:hypothetical protein
MRGKAKTVPSSICQINKIYQKEGRRVDIFTNLCSHFIIKFYISVEGEALIDSSCQRISSPYYYSPLNIILAYLYYFIMSKSSPFHVWPLEKQYLAAQFYLNEEKPLFINDAQKSQLMALHMQVVYGSCKEGILLPEIQKCTPVERKKRYNDWKQLGSEKKIPAMKKFIDLMNNLFPSWFKNLKVNTVFELEWMKLQKNQENFILTTSLTEKTLEIPLTPAKKLQNSITPQYKTSRKSFFNSTEISSAMKTISTGNEEISGLKFRQEYYKINHFDTSSAENSDFTPIVLRNLFETLESQSAAKSKKKSGDLRETIIVPLKITNNDSLEKCVQHIKELLVALEENSSELYDGDLLQQAMANYETDIVESILRPKLEILSGVIKEIELIFKNEHSTRVKIVAEIHDKFVRAVETLFSYLQALDKTKIEVAQQKLNSDKTTKMLEQGFLAIKELNDPVNTKYSLYGVTKLTKSMYLQNLNNSKDYLPQEDVDIMIEIEHMLTSSEEKIKNLVSDLKQKDLEILKIKKILKEVQEKSYKDNIELAGQCKKLKESLGLIRGTKNQDMRLETSYKAENDLLKAELEDLKNEKNSLLQEILRTKLKN